MVSVFSHFDEALGLGDPLFDIIFEGEFVVIMLLKNLIHVMGGILVKLAPHDFIQDPVSSDELTPLALKGEVRQHQRFLVAVESIYWEQLGKLIEFLEVIFNGFRRRMGGLNRAERVLDV